VKKAPVKVALGDLEQTYDGKPKPATSTTIPDRLTVSITYNEKDKAPVMPEATRSRPWSGKRTTRERDIYDDHCQGAPDDQRSMPRPCGAMAMRSRTCSLQTCPAVSPPPTTAQTRRSRPSTATR